MMNQMPMQYPVNMRQDERIIGFGFGRPWGFGRRPFFGGPFLGGLAGGLLAGALLAPRPYYYPYPYAYPYPYYGYQPFPYYY